MGVHVFMLPRIVTKGGPGGSVCLAPDFGSLDMTGRKWGQASSKIGDETSVAVWVECDDAEVTALVGGGAKLLGTALDDANAARVKDAMAVEKPPRFDEAVAKRAVTKQAGGALFSLKADAQDADIATAFRSFISANAASIEVSNDVASFDRPASREFTEAYRSIVAPLEK